MDPRKSKTRAGTSAGDQASPGAGAGNQAGTDVYGRDAGEAKSAGAGSIDEPARVGSVAVEVDRPAILAEAAAVAASSSDAPPAPAGELEPAIAGADVQAKANDVAPALRLLVSQCAGTFAPNWEISKEEGDGVADAAALVMAYWMPDGVLEPKYLAIITLASSLYGVAAQRRNDDGSWRPLRAPRAPASSSTSPAPAPAPNGGGGAPLRIV